MSILTQLCSIPTAPFVEHRVAAFVERFAAARAKFLLSRDEFGNILIELPGRIKSPRLVLVAHMDHPGLVARRMIDDRTLDADFRGGVLSRFVRGAKVRFFDAQRQITGTVIAMTPDKYRPTFPGRAIVRVAEPVSRGSAGMFDQGTSRTRDGRLYARACDDLGGVAAALATLDHLRHRPPRSTVAALLTRAEEVGFIGAMACVLHPSLLHQNDRIISVECSAIQPCARQGDGVILRVGDRTSVFDSAFLHFLHDQAQALAKLEPTFRYQRALMPGGTCEATVFDLYGYTAGAVCVPLGNYHNMNHSTGRIGPEHVHLRDWRNMVKLLVRIGQHVHEFTPHSSPLRQRIERRFARLRRFLRPDPIPRARMGDTARSV